MAGVMGRPAARERAGGFCDGVGGPGCLGNRPMHNAHVLGLPGHDHLKAQRNWMANLGCAPAFCSAQRRDKSCDRRYTGVVETEATNFNVERDVSVVDPVIDIQHVFRITI